VSAYLLPSVSPVSLVPVSRLLAVAYWYRASGDPQSPGAAAA